VESASNQVPEPIYQQAMIAANEAVKKIINLQNKLLKEANSNSKHDNISSSSSSSSNSSIGDSAVESSQISSHIDHIQISETATIKPWKKSYFQVSEDLKQALHNIGNLKYSNSYTNDDFMDKYFGL
jgi:polyribonucleotide nucleotidyltransferase